MICFSCDWQAMPNHHAHCNGIPWAVASECKRLNSISVVIHQNDKFDKVFLLALKTLLFRSSILNAFYVTVYLCTCSVGRTASLINCGARPYLYFRRNPRLTTTRESEMLLMLLKYLILKSALKMLLGNIDHWIILMGEGSCCPVSFLK